MAFRILFFSIFLYSFSVSLYADLKEGKKAYARKDFSKAMDEFQKFNDANPTSGEAWMYMGYIYEYRRDYPKSIQSFKKAVSLSLPKKDLINCYQKIILYFNYQRDYHEVISYSNRLLKISPDLSHIQKIRSTAEERLSSGHHVVHHHSKKHSEETETAGPSNEEEYLKILKKEPNNASARWNLSLIYANHKKFQQAETLLEGLVKDFPEKHDYLYKYGVILIRLEKYSEALRILDKLENKIGNDNAKMLYYANLNQAVAYHKMKHYEEAAKYYRKSYTAHNTVQPLIGLTKLKYEVKDCENAIKTAEKALEFGERTHEIRMYLALCKIQNKEETEGYTILKEIASKLEKENPEFKNLPDVYNDGILKLARYYTNRGEYEKALRYFHSVQSSEEEEREYRFYLGKAYYYTGKIDQSILLLEKVNNSSGAYYLLAKCYANKDNLEKTMEYIRKAAEIKPAIWSTAAEEKEFDRFKEKSSFKSFLETKGSDKETNQNNNQALDKT
ncbi:tetratricopeptide repeat protein [Leptospira interrogans]|uniref:Tetratricopeptide repeat protein n=12 Tax=Leptospira interrogans TaxID=173 RepID=A0AAQ0AX80_LEPIR|nr:MULTISPECIES: tetratricopeptide repeat protein [Leptospira]APH40057.1 Anaphase-promoting complex, cyclosome, subunit 3 [Leptospira interrogans serovar Copenhageni/Icterohaemorrhagiae]EMF72756.1 anaphase-promoting complex, cyclosome, subunit 3 [Leptospira interrogans serovar Canicola str. LT1962]EMG08484.1 anaphase-promoting complex, cyclosome, subunit 3 [Leptospira interrogans serovar Grippotyphosa str. LT2186]EMG24044.1 anaphase-promoting complex, cyclosome, subunit 3 [Leptospira interrogan